jgi:hypothetical protein
MDFNDPRLTLRTIFAGYTFTIKQEHVITSPSMIMRSLTLFSFIVLNREGLSICCHLLDNLRVCFYSFGNIISGPYRSEYRF